MKMKRWANTQTFRDLPVSKLPWHLPVCGLPVRVYTGTTHTGWRPGTGRSTGRYIPRKNNIYKKLSKISKRFAMRVFRPLPRSAPCTIAVCPTYVYSEIPCISSKTVVRPSSRNGIRNRNRSKRIEFTRWNRIENNLKINLNFNNNTFFLLYIIYIYTHKHNVCYETQRKRFRRNSHSNLEGNLPARRRPTTVMKKKKRCIRRVMWFMMAINAYCTNGSRVRWRVRNA